MNKILEKLLNHIRGLYGIRTTIVQRFIPWLPSKTLRN